MADNDERRGRARVRVSLPMAIKPSDAANTDPSEIKDLATTRDFSVNGVFFYFDKDLEPGTKIEFFIDLNGEMPVGKGVTLHCTGNILRIEDETGNYDGRGVAVCIEKSEVLLPSTDTDKNAPDQNTSDQPAE